MARLISASCDRFDDASAPHIFFSAHGLPVKYIETLGDPYKVSLSLTAPATTPTPHRAPPVPNRTHLVLLHRALPIAPIQPRPTLPRSTSSRATPRLASPHALPHGPASPPFRPAPQAQIEASVEFIMARLKTLGYANDHTLAYQACD